MGMDQRIYVGPILKVRSTADFDIRTISEQSWFEKIFDLSNVCDEDDEWYYFTLVDEINGRDPWYRENDVRPALALTQIADMNVFYERGGDAYKRFLQNVGPDNMQIFYGVITEYS